jgi:hypothetical protein
MSSVWGQNILQDHRIQLLEDTKAEGGDDGDASDRDGFVFRLSGEA